MLHARSDYNAIQPWPTKRPHIVKVDGVMRHHDDIKEWEAPSSIDPLIPDDEPVFLIRAQDMGGPATVRYWADYVEHIGGAPELVARVREWADIMARYQVNNGVKVPDVPEGVFP